jgi:hydroxyethylthiazole kinase
MTNETTATATTTTIALDVQIAQTLERLRARHPLVHCMTNQVVKDITANVLLAIGAAPAMVEQPDEAAEFAAIADALLINLGTLDDAQIAAMRRAIPSAIAAGKPWVLDPVAVGPITLRTRFAREILQWKPALIRGNASEIIALAGHTGKGRGVDSGDRPDAALDAAAQLNTQTGAAILVTGPVDYALDATRTITCANGHELLTRVTGVGCAQGALAAALLAVAETPLQAAATAALLIALAGELAAARATHPGAFRTAFLDELDRLDTDTIHRHAKLQLFNRHF